tara:strand:- start:1073 stop:1312 length:240 start_codon:yes stop_codon:yes gene_type:complete
MLNSTKELNYQRHASLPRGDHDNMPKGCADDSLNESIPSRYRNGRGGIDLERVQLDQNEARRQVIQAMIRRIEKLWRQR